ncbi:MAG: hypothetical protein QOJ63_1486 [Solirubrobacteraceae bacterium]|jgi:signal transduction histidine kinase|nr:hypothetical protein [Solirubrobacteraceae bacterium]
MHRGPAAVALPAGPAVRRAAIIAALAVGGVALGIVAEAQAQAQADAGLGAAAADIATGWTLLACGLWGIAARPAQRRWLLVVASGLTWFAGTLSTDLVYLHRGPLVHAMVAATRDRSPLAAAAVAAGYCDAVIVTDANAWLSIAVAVLLVVVAARRRPDARVVGSVGALVVALALAASTVLADVSADYTRAALYVYEAALCAAALLLVVAATRDLRIRGSVADLVVELGPARRSSGVRDALARALGDPSLTVGYWLPEGERYVDLEGNPFVVPAAGDRRAATVVEHDGRRIAALVHDASLLDDPQLVAAVREGAGLMLANDRLQAEAEARLGEIRASRERIVTARYDQRRRLATRLHARVERRLDDVAVAVRRARVDAEPGLIELLDVVGGELDEASAELRELGRGIHPRSLTESGLAVALAGLAEHAPVPVAVSAPADRPPEAIEAAAYFVCSEALANVAKHARATCASCDVELRGGVLHITVADDGVGGADARRGSGLRGLADRVEALGGRLTVSSSPGEGTSIGAFLPIERGSG